MKKMVMKKYLILLLIVLGIVNVASASLIGGFNPKYTGWTVRDGWTGSTTQGGEISRVFQNVETYNIGNGITLTPTEGTAFCIGDYTDIKWIRKSVQVNAGDTLEFDYATTSGYLTAMGNYFTTQSTTESPWIHGSIDLSSFVGQTNIDFSFTDVVALDNVRIVPEPATLAILALGGLLIRRKK